MRAAKIETIVEQINRGAFPVNERCGENASCHLERALPYLVVCRTAGDTEKALIINESSYIWAEDTLAADEVIKGVAEALSDCFGALVLVEFWIGEGTSKCFRLRYPERMTLPVVKALKQGFGRAIGSISGISVEHDSHAPRSPEGYAEFFSETEGKQRGILKLGIEVPGFFSDPVSGYPYPVFFRRFRQRFANTVKQAVYAFIRVQTNLDLRHYQMLGRKHLGAPVWQVDRAFSKIERSFEFLLLVAPANYDAAWKAFRASGCSEDPVFHYPLLPVDPDRLKRQLYAIDIDKVDDPSIAYLFREKREELDTLITMLNERDSESFMLSGLRLFKTVDSHLLEVANELLKIRGKRRSGPAEFVNARQFAELAREEFSYYQRQYHGFQSSVEIRNDVTGLMVSQGRLLIGKGLKVPTTRVEALLHHEVGTHVVTYCNGAAQPFSQLKEGLAGYDELQEGIAVLAEYLCGGLSVDRLRVLAARVVAAQRLIDGENFTSTFKFLVEEQRFSQSLAFNLVTRIHQSGGYIKDIIYLRGLIRLMAYLKNGGELEPLFVGKIAEKHIPIVQELQHRSVLKPLPVLPRYLAEESCLNRLERIRNGLSLTQIVKEEIQ